MRKNYTIFIMSVIAAAVTFVLIPRSTHALTFKSSTPISFTFNPTLTLSISGDLAIDELVPGTQANSDDIQIDVSTNVAGGYYLTATVGSSSTDNRLTNQDNSDYFFENLSKPVNVNSLPNNTWGYRCDAYVGGHEYSECDYDTLSGLPLDADDTGATGAVLLDIYAPARSFSIDFAISAKASATQPAGTYTNTINFYAISKPLPEAKTIEDLEYMQDFATLDSIDKESVLTSMTENYQYTLKDSRDNKEYYIAKLADGNVWMTQNLDHDIVTTTGFYTSENTDLDLPDGANFTMNTATYATDDTDWGYSITSPRSYDPGNLCWNGSLTNSGGALATMTIPCTDSNANKHYSIGNYYNWTAAVAMNDSSGYTTDQQDVGQSICPAGWRLPTTTENNYNKSYQNLVTSLSLTAGPQGNIQNNPVYFAYGGYWGGESWGVGSYGYYWSSVVHEKIFSYELHFSGVNSYLDGYLFPQSNTERFNGYSVRCVAR